MTTNKDESIQITIVDQINNIDDYKNEWNQLSLVTPPYLPSCSHAYISAYLRTFLDKDDKWIIILAFINNDLVGVLPLIQKTVQLSILKSHALYTPANSDTFGVTPLISNNNQQCILDALLNAAWRKFPYMRYINICDTPSKSNLDTIPCKHKKISIHNRVGHYLPVNNNFPEYIASLSKNFRQNLKKAQKKLYQLPEVNYHFVSDKQINNDYFHSFLDIETNNWKGSNGTAIKCSRIMTDFYQALTKNMATLGQLEWHILKTKEQIIAINMAIRYPETSIILKIGYDDAYSKCSPGSLLLYKYIELAFNDTSLNEIDVITDTQWHHNWKMSDRSYFTLRYYNTKSFASLMFGFTHDRIKLMLKNNKTLMTSYRFLKNKLFR